jgi:hypothetical protein
VKSKDETEKPESREEEQEQDKVDEDEWEKPLIIGSHGTAGRRAVVADSQGRTMVPAMVAT